MRDLDFVDTETGGFDASRHALLEVAVVRVDPRTLEERGRLVARVRPAPGLVVDPEAAAVNGYTPEEWATAPTEAEALPAVAAMLRGAMFAGQNPAFDRDFLRAAFDRAHLSWPAGDYHLLDVASLAWPLVVRGDVDSVSLRKVSAWMGLPPLAGHHRAEADIDRTIEVYRRLLEIYRPERAASGHEPCDQCTDADPCPGCEHFRPTG